MAKDRDFGIAAFGFVALDGVAASDWNTDGCTEVGGIEPGRTVLETVVLAAYPGRGDAVVDAGVDMPTLLPFQSGDGEAQSIRVSFILGLCRGLAFALRQRSSTRASLCCV